MTANPGGRAGRSDGKILVSRADRAKVFLVDHPVSRQTDSERSRETIPGTTEELLPLVYAELRKLAESRMSREEPGQTLQPTALVHEAFLRLGADTSWKGKAHFFGAAAQAMRRILIEKARQKARVRHGGHLRRVDVEMLDVAWETEPERLLLLDEVLSRLEAADPEAARLVSLRFFAGVPNAEAARLMGLSESTAKRTWAYARAFLHRAMTEEEYGP